MSSEDRERWDQRYAARGGALAAPLPFIMERLRTLPAGARILDVAAGDGRHAIPLARAGYAVTAIDVSSEGLARLGRFAEEAGVEVRTVERDLEADDPLDGLGSFEGAAIGFYKPPPWLWHPLARVVPPEGRIALATFNHEHARRTGFPRRYTLEPDELLHPHPGVELLEQYSVEEPERSYDAYLWKRV